MIEIVPSAQENIVYFIGEEQLDATIEEFTYLPADAGVISFEYSVAFDPVSSQAWGTLTGTTLAINSDDVNQVGEYTATLTGTLGDDAGSQATEEFTVTIASLLGTQADIEFKIGEATLRTPIV